MYYRGRFPGLSLETHPQLGGDVQVDQSSLQDQMWDYFNGLQRALLTKGMTAKTLSTQVADPSSHIDKHIEAICIILDIPKRKFMGSERGELSSGQNDDDWNDTVTGRRAGYAVPYIIVPTVKRLIRVGVLPVPKTGFKVSWEDNRKLRPKEAADIAKSRMEAMTRYVAGGVSALMDEMDFLTREMGFSEDDAKAILEALPEPEPDETVPPVLPQQAGVEGQSGEEGNDGTGGDDNEEQEED